MHEKSAYSILPLAKLYQNFMKMFHYSFRYYKILCTQSCSITLHKGQRLGTHIFPKLLFSYAKFTLLPTYRYGKDQLSSSVPE